MTVTITPSGTNRVFTYTKTAPTARILAEAEDAAHQLFDMGVIGFEKPFDQLTNAEKFNILDRAITQYIRRFAREYHVKTALVTAQTTAEAEADQIY